jgi:hypothetical protein
MAKKPISRSTARRKSSRKPRLMKIAEKTIEPAKPTTFGPKKLAIIFLLILIFGTLIYNFKHFFIVALVNHTPITRFAFDRQLEQQIGKDFLENEINRHLILQETSRQQIVVKPAEIEAKISEIEKQVESRGAKLADLLAAQGQTLESLKNQLETQLAIEKILSKDISVAEEEVKAYYDQNKTSFAKDQTFDQLKTIIIQQLRQQKLSEKITPWLQDLRAKANIQYFLKF